MDGMYKVSRGCARWMELYKVSRGCARWMECTRCLEDVLNGWNAQGENWRKKSWKKVNICLFFENAPIREKKSAKIRK